MKIYKSPYAPLELKRTEYNLGQFLRDGWRRHPNNLFIDADSGVRYTGQECATLSQILAERLAKQLQLAKGDIVAICTASTVRTPLFLSAVWALNAAATGLDIGHKEDEYIELTEPLQPKLFICNQSNLAVALKVKQALPCIKYIVVLDDEPATPTGDNDGCVVWFGSLCRPTGGSSEAADASAEVEIAPDQIAYLPRTSGTTGRSKAVMHSHRTLLSASLMMGAPDVMVWSAGSTIMATSSIHHAYCLVDVFLAIVNRGYSFVHAQTTDPALILERIQRFNVYALFTTPYILILILNLFKTKNPVITRNTDLSCLRAIVSATNVFPEDLFPYLRECLPDLQSFGNCYGLTEAIAGFGHRYEGFEKPCTIGRILANGEFRIVSPETLKDVEEGQRGELWIRVPCRMVGYHNDRKAFEEAMAEGEWYKTGDICTVDSDGYVKAVDRLKEFIKTKYSTVSPGEVEAKILQYPKVRDVAVVGLPHPVLHNALHAIVAPNEPVTEEELHRHMADVAPDIYKLEGGITFCDAVPRTAMGKLMRRNLVQWVLDRQAKST